MSQAWLVLIARRGRWRRIGLLGCIMLLLAAVPRASGDEYARMARFDRWSPLQSSTLARSEVAAARVGRFIYVVGGYTPGGGIPTLPTSAVERYDIRGNRWRRMRPLPVELNHATAVGHRGKLYVHGGYPGLDPDMRASAQLLRFDPRRNRWSRLPSSGTPRAGHAAAVIGHRLYVAGGADDPQLLEDDPLRSLEVYDFRRRRWHRGRSFPGPARHHVAGVASGGFLYVLAGRSGLRDGLPRARDYRAVERYNPRTGRWQKMPSLRRARSGFPAVRLGDGRIVVFGGEPWPNNLPGADVIGSVEIFNPVSRRWRRLPRMRTPRHAPGGAALHNRVYAIEGSTQPRARGPSRKLEVLDVR
jgi:N-acetylneuraminic acid mutarotase